MSLFQRTYTTNPGLHYCIESERLEEVKQALGQCLSAQEQVVVLLLLDGLDQGGIAELLGLTQHAIFYRLCNVRQKIADALPRLANELYERGWRKNGSDGNFKYKYGNKDRCVCGEPKERAAVMCWACRNLQRVKDRDAIRAAILECTFDGMNQSEIITVVLSRGRWYEKIVRSGIQELEREGVFRVVAGPMRSKLYYRA